MDAKARITGLAALLCTLALGFSAGAADAKEWRIATPRARRLRVDESPRQRSRRNQEGN